MNTILVTGGTGTLGRPAVRQLLDAGHEVRVASRHARPVDGAESVAVDLRGTAGIETAVHDVHTIVHCATSPRGDVAAARNLIAAARRADVAHLLYISIVGVDRHAFVYYRTKRAVERLFEESGLGWTILRTTQFHDLLLRLWEPQSRLPVVLVPSGVSVQPVDVREVAVRLAGLAGDAPAGYAPEMGGPEVRTTHELARAYLRATGRRRPLLPVRLPAKAFRDFRAGKHLAPRHADGRCTFEEFLAERFGSEVR